MMSPLPIKPPESAPETPAESLGDVSGAQVPDDASQTAGDATEGSGDTNYSNPPEQE